MSKNDLVIATGNPGKVQEFNKILGEDSFAFHTLRDIGFNAAIVENGSTFAANAEIKAQAVACFLREQGLDWPVLADDSGLEVSALGGAPGIFTARYAGEGASDEENYRKLLQNLSGNRDRQARFFCALCWLRPAELEQPGSVHLFYGECQGQILESPRGDQGFGYDPVFQPQGYPRSFAEMTHEEKKALSHRGAAIRELRAWLNKSS
ncbi:MAG TPA: RdgB/HAM1 family non-canonical purine NTP pyrophosphatase [Fibrobacteraceae bacterium]|nr:RdgB/HAM1 family non-canonical purine NTP pyrophosphatase [Fibrobacteraceae bacterium]